VFWGNHSGQHLANRIAADQCLAGPRHEASFRIVQSDHRIKIAGVEILLEQAWPIFRLIRYIVSVVGGKV
jgi:hypothetical protein